jgi:hypothetical protein
MAVRMYRSYLSHTGRDPAMSMAILSNVAPTSGVSLTPNCHPEGPPWSFASTSFTRSGERLYVLTLSFQQPAQCRCSTPSSSPWDTHWTLQLMQIYPSTPAGSSPHRDRSVAPSQRSSVAAAMTRTFGQLVYRSTFTLFYPVSDAARVILVFVFCAATNSTNFAFNFFCFSTVVKPDSSRWF